MAKGKDKEHASEKRSLDQWLEEARALPDDITAPPMPIAIFLDEAGGAGRFMRTYWEPAPDGKRPGLVAAGAKRRQLVDRGEQILAELAAAIDFVLDDDVEEQADDVWRAAKQRDGADETQASVAQALVDFAGIADTIRNRLSGLTDFDVELIEEARRVSADITREGPSSVGRPSSEDINMRNRMLALLSNRVSAVRRAARYVFRHQPEIARQASSAYERRKRHASRKAAGDMPSPAPTPA